METMGFANTRPGSQPLVPGSPAKAVVAYH